MTTLGTGNNRSFTFIELLLVVVLIGVAAGVSIPYFRKTFSDLKLQSFAGDLQTFMNYLRERSIVDGQIIILAIDSEKKEYWAQAKDAQDRLKTYRIPPEISIESSQKEVFFYPDGTIDKVTIKLLNHNERAISLTTEGVFGGVKLQAPG